MDKRIEIISVLAELKEREQIINLAFFHFDNSLDSLIAILKKDYKLAFKCEKKEFKSGLSGVCYSYKNKENALRGDTLLVYLTLQIFLEKQKGDEFKEQREIIAKALTELKATPSIYDFNLCKEDFKKLEEVRDKVSVTLKKNDDKRISVCTYEGFTNLETIKIPKI